MLIIIDDKDENIDDVIMVDDGSGIYFTSKYF